MSKTIRVSLTCDHVDCEDICSLIEQELGFAPSQMHIEDRTIPLSGDQQRQVVFSYLARDYEGEVVQPHQWKRHRDTIKTVAQFQDLLLRWMREHGQIETIDTVPDIFH